MKIQVLPPDEARRIAAGEVIDRPAALVREFLDNAIDAGAVNIEVLIEEGGCKKIEVIDDGSGMTREDMELCTLTHATSKIRCLDDLETALTLGFRGEALSAAAAVARLEIVASTDGREAWLMQAGHGENFPSHFEQHRRTKGATVRALNLFENIPARKKFLKREGSEAALCRQVFIDKALAFPQINFRFIQDGKLKDFFPVVSTKKERFAAALLQAGDANYLHEIIVTGNISVSQRHSVDSSVRAINRVNGFSAEVVIGSPDLYRNDRRQMFVFVNGRRVNDYSLIQAMDYGAQGWFPNGTHPISAVYVEIDPALADFNIHPAKREVRFRDPGAIHQAVSGGLRSFFHRHFLSASRNDAGFKNESFYRNAETQIDKSAGMNEELKFSYNAQRFEGKISKPDISHFMDAMHSKFESGEHLININNDSYLCENQQKEPRYAGRVFGLFILIEWGDRLFIIDQHAAHERILYNKFLSQPIPKQDLLVPIPFAAESNEDDLFLETKREELLRLGIEIKKDESTAGNESWQILSLPSAWTMSDAATVREILELRTAGENMAERWASTLCCRAAIKDGDYPDDDTAFALGKEALNLPDPRCPHGRPIWTEINKDALFKAVRRE